MAALPGLPILETFYLLRRMVVAKYCSTSLCTVQLSSTQPRLAAVWGALRGISGQGVKAALSACVQVSSRAPLPAPLLRPLLPLVWQTQPTTSNSFSTPAPSGQPQPTRALVPPLPPAQLPYLQTVVLPRPTTVPLQQSPVQARRHSHGHTGPHLISVVSSYEVLFCFQTQ